MSVAYFNTISMSVSMTHSMSVSSEGVRVPSRSPDSVVPSISRMFIVISGSGYLLLRLNRSNSFSGVITPSPVS